MVYGKEGILLSAGPAAPEGLANGHDLSEWAGDPVYLHAPGYSRTELHARRATRM